MSEHTKEIWLLDSGDGYIDCVSNPAGFEGEDSTVKYIRAELAAKREAELQSIIDQQAKRIADMEKDIDDLYASAAGIP